MFTHTRRVASMHLSKLVLLLYVGTVVLAIPFLGELKERDEQLLGTYDYVIVGGGTSGLAVANRLSENPKSECSSVFYLVRSMISPQVMVVE